MDKPFRTVACVGNLEHMLPWLAQVLTSEERVVDLCAEFKRTGSVWTFLGTERGPLELVLCDERRTLVSLVQADACVAVQPQSMSFAFVAAALGAHLCLPEGDVQLPINAIWEHEVDPIDVSTPFSMRVDAVTKVEGSAIPSGTILSGHVALGDVVTLPGTGSWTVAKILSEESERQTGQAGEVVGLVLSDFETPPELVGSLFCDGEAVQTVPVAISDGSARLWWSSGWVRASVKDGVATLRAPRILRAGTKLVVARSGEWSLSSVGSFEGCEVAG